MCVCFFYLAHLLFIVLVCSFSLVHSISLYKYITPSLCILVLMYIWAVSFIVTYSASVIIDVHIFKWIYVMLLLGIFLEMKFWGHGICTWLAFCDTASFLNWFYQFTFSLAMSQDSRCSTYLMLLNIFNFIHSGQYIVEVLGDFKCIFLMSKEVDHLFMFTGNTDILLFEVLIQVHC